MQSTPSHDPVSGEHRVPDAAIYSELQTTFRFYIALTVFANLGYALAAALYVALLTQISHPIAVAALIIPAMISTGFAALSGAAVGEAFGLHRAIQTVGARLQLPHVTRSAMLPVQTILTLIFHALIALLLYSAIFFHLIGVIALV